MPALLFAQNLSKSFGAKPLFRGITFGVAEKDRVGIIGPNGSGKSTLLKILAGLEQPDQGTVTRRQRLRVAFVPQAQGFDPNATVGEIVGQVARSSGISAEDYSARVQETLGRAGFKDPKQTVQPLSGGWRKRLAIACGFVQTPDVMLLDEPTNHLDYEGLSWLEEVMGRAPWPWVMVTHDRWFMERVTNQVAELHARYAQGIFCVSGTYSKFLEEREAHVFLQHQHTQALAGKVRREEEWLRRSPKARTTKAKYRIDTAEALQKNLAQAKTRLRSEETSVDFVGSGRKTKQLIVVEQLTKSFGERTLIQGMEWVIGPGMSVGVLGHNGSGKTTLLKLLAKEIIPDQGLVRHAERLRVVYFDQQRTQINPQNTLRQMLSDTGYTVTYREQTIHIAGWAKRFGFLPEQLDLPMERLSGGEQARAIIARLMLQPADVLIVDEPTNDLDIPTREVLEESLKEFPGGLVLVTHDRYMLENVCQRYLGLDGNGLWAEFADYEQWKAWLRQHRAPCRGLTRDPQATRLKKKAKKLSYLEQREYDNLEQHLIEAEAEVDRVRGQTEDPTVVTDHVRIQQVYEELKAAEQEVERLYVRWEELETKLQGEM